MKSNFRILFDCHSFDIGWQGTTTYLAGILNALPDEFARIAPNLKLEIYCAAQHEENVRRYLHIDFKFVYIPTGIIRRNLVAIPKILKNIHADLVVSQYVRPFFAPCPTLSVIHDVLFLDHPETFRWSYRFVRKLLFGWSARNSSIVSTVSENSAEKISAHFGINKSNIAVIPNAVNPAFSDIPNNLKRSAQPHVLHLLSVSRLEKRKRHEWGIEAMDVLAKCGIESEYVIVGSGCGKYANDLIAKINDAVAINSYKISLKNGLSVDELMAEYAKADIFLFPSEAEGFGIPVIEAAAAGKPCVCSTGGALIELAEDFSGICFNPHDKATFLAGVQEVARNLTKYTKEAKYKQRSIIKKFNWANAAEKYAQLICELPAE